MQAPKGPNALHMIGYMNAEEEEQDYLDEAASSRPNIDVKAIEDQFDNFVDEMQKYDQILSDVAKNIEEIEGEKDFITDFYPPFIWESTYEEEQEKKIVASSDPQLAKVIQSLQKNNKLLKDDMRAWVLEFAKTAKLSEVLISQNKVLKQSITKKNQEVVKLIDTIGRADNQDITELLENLELLKEENGVLKGHLFKLKQETQQKQLEEERVNLALKSVQENFMLLEKQKGDAEDEEEHLSKTLELVQQWMLDGERRRKKLEKEREGLTFRKKQYLQEKDKIQRQLQLCTREKSQLETGLKRQFSEQEGQKYRLMEEIHQLGDLIAKHKSQCRYFDEETTWNNNKKAEYEKQVKLYADKLKASQEQLKASQKQLQKVSEAEVAADCRIEVELYDIHLLRKELKQLEEREKEMQEECGRAFKRSQESHSRQIADWQSKVNQSKREQAMRLLQERSQLGSKEKELKRWEDKVFEKKDELADLKGQMREIRDNQARLAKLKQQLLASEKQ